MAEQDLQMDVAPEEKKSSKMMLIIIVLVVVVLGGGAAAFFLMGGEEEVVEEAVPADDAILPAIYMPLRPSFVVNFANSAGKTRFLQVEVTLMGRDPVFMSGLEDHLPLVKSRLVDVFQSQDFEELRTPEGKEGMRAFALEELRSMLEQELGDPGIEMLYFTIFVLQ